MKHSLQMAFDILKRHPECIRDDVVLNDLMTDIADAIDGAVACIQAELTTVRRQREEYHDRLTLQRQTP